MIDWRALVDTISRRRSEAACLAEINDFNHRTAKIADHSVGYFLAHATDVRKEMERLGLPSPMDPPSAMHLFPEYPTWMHGCITRFLNSGHKMEAGCCIMWLHTLRSTYSRKVRVAAVAMWDGLERGFPFIAAEAEEAGRLSGLFLDWEGGDRRPVGL